MNQFNFYIGANNDTGICEKTKIMELFGHLADICKSGYTIVESIGHYEGNMEASVVVTMFAQATRSFMVQQVADIAFKLEQRTICLQSLIGDKNVEQFIDFVEAEPLTFNYDIED